MVREGVMCVGVCVCVCFMKLFMIHMKMVIVITIKSEKKGLLIKENFQMLPSIFSMAFYTLNFITEIKFVQSFNINSLLKNNPA